MGQWSPWAAEVGERGEQLLMGVRVPLGITKILRHWDYGFKTLNMLTTVLFNVNGKNHMTNYYCIATKLFFLKLVITMILVLKRANSETPCMSHGDVFG